MAGALAPVVWLMVLASVLFASAGIADGIYPGGASWSFGAYGGLGWTSYVFGLVNLVVAVLIARGSERSLILRLGLSAFFVVERTTTAFFPVTKSAPSVGIHLATAVVEAVILAATWRVWRLGQAVSATDLASLALPQSGGGAVLLAARAGGAAAVASEPLAVIAPVPPLAEVGRGARARGSMASRVVPRIPVSSSRAIGVLAFLLAATFIAEAVMSGIVPGGTVDLAAPDWLVYLYALAVVALAAVAVHGRRLPLRLLLAVSVILFIERAFTPFLFVGQEPDTTALALHLVAALLALLLAVASAAALRTTRLRRSAPAS